MKVDMLPASSSTPATTLDLNLNEEKENELKRKNAKISSYYENLRTNVFSLLGIVLFFKNLQHPYLISTLLLLIYLCFNSQILLRIKMCQDFFDSPL